MRKMRAKYESNCRECGTCIHPGQTILWSKDTGAIHENCEESGDPEADREYYNGLRDGQEYSDNVKMFGREMADYWAMERELRDGDY